MMFLGLDTSMSTTREGKMGWASGSPGDVPDSGVLELPVIVEGDWDPVLEVVDAFFRQRIAAPGVKRVGYESSFFSAGKSDIVYFGNCQRLVGFLQAFCWQAGVEIGPVAISSWRKSFIGTGKAPKGLSQDERKRWWKRRAFAQCHARGWLKVVKTDQAEACGIWSSMASKADAKHASGNVANLPLFEGAA